MAPRGQLALAVLGIPAGRCPAQREGREVMWGGVGAGAAGILLENLLGRGEPKALRGPTGCAEVTSEVALDRRPCRSPAVPHPEGSPWCPSRLSEEAEPRSHLRGGRQVLRTDVDPGGLHPPGVPSGSAVYLTQTPAG